MQILLASIILWPHLLMLLILLLLLCDSKLRFNCSLRVHCPYDYVTSNNSSAITISSPSPYNHLYHFISFSPIWPGPITSSLPIILSLSTIFTLPIFSSPLPLRRFLHFQNYLPFHHFLPFHHSIPFDCLFPINSWIYKVISLSFDG